MNSNWDEAKKGSEDDLGNVLGEESNSFFQLKGDTDYSLYIQIREETLRKS